MRKGISRSFLKFVMALAGTTLSTVAPSGWAAAFCTGQVQPCWVSASGPLVAESGMAQFNFYIPQPVGNEARLTLAFSGTASNGVDFQLRTNQVLLPAGQTSVSMSIAPIVDALAEGSESVTVTIVSSDNVCVPVGSPNSATVNIVDGNASFTTSLDDSNLVWTTGSPGWNALSAITHDGVDAAQSGLPADNQESWLQTTVAGPGTLTFWWKVSSEVDFDWLRFHIDGVLQQQISGEVNWQQRTFYLPQGGHTLRWRYVKDSSSPAGQDAAWLDQVSFVPGVGSPSFVVQPSNQIAWAGANVTLSAVALGAQPLSSQWIFNDTNVLANATNASLMLSNVSALNAGRYRLVVSNHIGAATSTVASVVLTNPSPVTQVLFFSDSLVQSAFRTALTNLGQSHQFYTSESLFNSAVSSANRASTLVIIDAPQSPFYTFSTLAPFISGGGRAIIQAYVVTANPTLAAAFQGIVENRSLGPLAPYDWGGSELFRRLPSPIFFWEIGLFEDSQRLHPMANATAVAGFTETPAHGEAAIIIGNSGRTILNGLYVEGAMATSNAVRLAQNEIAFLIGAAGPPQFVVGPQSRYVNLGANISFGAIAMGERPLSLQWRKNGQPIAGATATNYSIAAVQSNHFGSYDVLASNALGVATSSVAILDFGVAPTIVQPPLSQSIVVGGDVTFSVAVAGDPAAFSYEWRRINPVPLFTNQFESTERTSYFSLTNVQSSLAGTYRLTVRNPASPNGTPTQFTLAVLNDNDADGMPDVWELEHGLATNDASDATLDFDGDGAANREEYLAGSNPTNSTSLFQFEPTILSNVMVLRFSAVSNKTYTVEATDVVPATNWSRVLDLIARATNRTEIITNEVGASPRYFRLVTPRRP